MKDFDELWAECQDKNPALKSARVVMSTAGIERLCLHFYTQGFRAAVPDLGGTDTPDFLKSLFSDRSA